MTTLEYYFSNGKHIVFHNHSISERGIIRNVARNVIISQRGKKYKLSSIVGTDNTRYTIRIARAIASTFLGKPPAPYHTADHIDRDSLNDTLENIRWASKIEQNNNQRRPTYNKSAFVIAKDGIELTAKGWEDALKDETTPYGGKYTIASIQHYAQQQRYGFGYKKFCDLPGEEWKVVAGSQYKNGEWYVSTEGRVKYKTRFAENVMTAEQLHNNKGYPVIKFSNKRWYCHIIAFKTFFPEKYAAKRDDEMVLHHEDNKLDFRPRMLTLGTQSQNQADAHNNGCHDNKKSARKPVASYINGEFEQEHESLASAARYLQWYGYPLATVQGIRSGLEHGTVHHGRTWKLIYKDTR